MECETFSGIKFTTESMFFKHLTDIRISFIVPPQWYYPSTRANVSFIGIEELAIRIRSLIKRIPSLVTEIDRNKVIIEDWVDSDDEETVLNSSEIQKKTIFNSENSETSFENKSPSSQNSVDQGSRKKGFWNKGGLPSPKESFYSPSAVLTREEVESTAKPKIGHEQVPSKSHYESVFPSGCSGRKGTIKTSCLDFEKVSYCGKELKFNFLSVFKSLIRNHNVLFTDNECSYLSPKATEDEAILWHRRLGHVTSEFNKWVKAICFVPRKDSERNIALQDSTAKWLSLKERIGLSFEAVTRKVQDCLHVNFLENQENQKGKGLSGCLELELLTHDQQFIVHGPNIHAAQNKPSEERTADKEVPLSSEEQALHDELSGFESMQDVTASIQAAQGMGCFVDLTDGKRVIGTPNGFRKQESLMGFYIKNKATDVAQGYRTSGRLHFIWQHSLEEVYVEQPPGFEDPAHPNKVYRVVKALYGPTSSPQGWGHKFVFVMCARFQVTPKVSHLHAVKRIFSGTMLGTIMDRRKLQEDVISWKKDWSLGMQETNNCGYFPLIERIGRAVKVVCSGSLMQIQNGLIMDLTFMNTEILYKPLRDDYSLMMQMELIAFLSKLFGTCSEILATRYFMGTVWDQYSICSSRSSHKPKVQFLLDDSEWMLGDAQGNGNLQGPASFSWYLLKTQDTAEVRGMITLKGANLHVMRLKRKHSSQAETDYQLKAKLKKLSKFVQPVVKHHALWVDSQKHKKRRKKQKKHKKKVSSVKLGRNKEEGTLSEEHYVQEEDTADPFFDDIVDKDVADLERKSDETE
ncbi:hypothetical protein Tco_0335292 [Tanacetum coccineum]